MEIFCASLAALSSGTGLVNAEIAAGESGLRLPGLRVCSACAGDYEDPDRTTWIEKTADGEGDEEDAGEHGASENEFPVQR